MDDKKKPGEAPDRQLPTRPSQFVDRKRFPRVAAREEMVRRLRVHDSYDGESTDFSADDFDLLRQIALETNVGEPDPWVRRHAISTLATLPTPENVNTLSLVARASPDMDARAEALLALGRSGIALAAPVLARALESADPLESAAASRALQDLGARLGAAQVLAAIPAPSLRPVADVLERKPVTRSRRRAPSATSEDRQPRSKR